MEQPLCTHQNGKGGGGRCCDPMSQALMPSPKLVKTPNPSTEGRTAILRKKKQKKSIKSFKKKKKSTFCPPKKHFFKQKILMYNLFILYQNLNIMTIYAYFLILTLTFRLNYIIFFSFFYSSISFFATYNFISFD